MSRSWIRSSTTHKFTKSWSLSLFPKHWTKQKKNHGLYHLNYQSHFWSDFNKHLKKILHLQVLFYCLFWLAVQSQKVFFRSLFYLLVLWSFVNHPHQMNKKKSRSVCGSMPDKLHQCVPPLSELSVFAIMKGYLPFFQISLIYSQ